MEPHLDNLPVYAQVLIWALFIFSGMTVTIVAYCAQRYVAKNDEAIENNSKAIVALGLATVEFSKASESFTKVVNEIHDKLNAQEKMLERHDHSLKLIFREFGREIKGHRNGNDHENHL